IAGVKSSGPIRIGGGLAGSSPLRQRWAYKLPVVSSQPQMLVRSRALSSGRRGRQLKSVARDEELNRALTRKPTGTMATAIAKPAAQPLDCSLRLREWRATLRYSSRPCLHSPCCGPDQTDNADAWT